MRPSRAPDASDPPPSHFEGIIGRRILGWLIDAAILVILAWIIGGGAVVLALLTMGLAGGLLLLPWGMALPILYATLSIASPLSATPGQALMGLVVRSEADGGHPTFGQAFTTATLHALSWAAGGLPLLAPIFSARSRTLHDLFSGTLVMRSAALPRRAAQAGRSSFLAEDG